MSSPSRARREADRRHADPCGGRLACGLCAGRHLPSGPSPYRWRHDADPGDRRGRLCRLGLGGGLHRGRARGRRPRRPDHRPSRVGPGPGRVPPRHLCRCRRSRPPARARADRGDPPLRRTVTGRRVDPRTGALLHRQCRRRGLAARGGPRGRRRAHRLLVDRRGLRRPGLDADPRGRAAPPDQPVRRVEAGLRGRAALVRARLRHPRRQPSLLQRRGRDRGARRGPRSRDAPDPERARGGRGHARR